MSLKTLHSGLVVMLILIIAAGIWAPPEAPEWMDGQGVAGARLDVPDADMDDTGIPADSMIHPVFFFARFFHSCLSWLPALPPLSSIYKPPRHA